MNPFALVARRHLWIHGIMSTALAYFTAAISAPANAQEPADLVLLGGKIITLDRQERIVSALAARAGKIVALGADAEIQPLIGPRTEVVRLSGQVGCRLHDASGVVQRRIEQVGDELVQSTAYALYRDGSQDSVHRRVTFAVQH